MFDVSAVVNANSNVVAICARRASLNERITTESNRITLWIIVEAKNGECCEKKK